MIFLNRPGELSQRERQKLARHLSSCKECAALQERIDNEFKILHALKQERIDIPEKSQMTNAIIQSIVEIENSRLQHGFVNWLNQYIPQMYWPRIRFVLSTCIFLIISAFLVQQVSILHRVSELEKNLNRQASLTGQSIQLSDRDIDSFFANMNQYASVQGDKILIDKKALQRLLQSYDKLQFTNKILLGYLEANIPGFDKENIDIRKLEKFINRKKNLQYLLKEL